MNLHTHEPEFDHDFYSNQNKIMEDRYSLLFKNSDISWKKYISNAKNKLNNNIYLIWIFLCGFETFLKSNGLNFDNKNILIKLLYKDAEDRIYRILGDSRKNEEYIKSL